MCAVPAAERAHPAANWTRMRVVLGALAALVLCGTVAGPASADGPGFKDTICPESTQYVVEVGKRRIDDPPERIYAVAHAASQAYATCSGQKLSYGFREAQHYADVRSAQFGVVAARALIALGRYSEARAELQRDRAAAQNVADWIAETEAFNSADVNGSAVTVAGDRRPSMYRASAREIVLSADQALAEVARLSEAPRRQGAVPAPTPSSSPRP
jgi:hypothetical protein